MTYLHILSSDKEVLLLPGWIQLVVLEHHGWLHMTIEGNLIPVATEEEPRATADFLNGGVVALVRPAWDDAPAAIMPSLGTLVGGGIGLLNLADEADIGCEDLRHLAMTEHDVTARLVSKEFTLTCIPIDDADGG